MKSIRKIACKSLNLIEPKIRAFSIPQNQVKVGYVTVPKAPKDCKVHGRGLICVRRILYFVGTDGLAYDLEHNVAYKNGRMNQNTRVRQEYEILSSGIYVPQKEVHENMWFGAFRRTTAHEKTRLSASTRTLLRIWGKSSLLASANNLVDLKEVLVKDVGEDDFRLEEDTLDQLARNNVKVKRIHTP